MALHEKPDPQGTLPEAGRLPPPPAGEPARPDDDPQHSDQEYTEQLDALRRAQQGDQDAFRWLLETNERRVFGLVIRMLGCDRHTAADISQEVFLRAFRSLESFDGRALFRTWLHKITMNLCITEYRKRKALKRDRPTFSIDAPVKGYDDLRFDPESHDVIFGDVSVITQEAPAAELSAWILVSWYFLWTIVPGGILWMRYWRLTP